MNVKQYWTVGRKIAAGFLLSLIITFVVGLIGFLSVGALGRSLKEMGASHVPRLQALEELNGMRLQARLTVVRALLTRGEDDYAARLAELRDERARLFAEMDAAWDVVENAPAFSSEGAFLFELLQSDYRLWRSGHNDMLDPCIDGLIRRPPGPELDALFAEFAAVYEKLVPVSDSFSDELESLRRSNLAKMDEIIAANELLSFTAKFRVVFFIMLGLIVAVTLSVIVTNLITVPVRDALQLLQAMSKGENIQKIETQSGDEIGQMIRLLQNEIAAKLKAEDISRSNVEFLAMMSHEIRTPLNAILGLSELRLLRAGTDGSEDEAREARTAFRQIKESGAGLLRIVNDVLDISKMEMGKMEFAPRNYDVARLLSGLTRRYRPLAEKRGLEFTVDIGPNIPAVLFGDDERVRQALDNLLSNAFKFTDAGFVRFGMSVFNVGNGVFVTFTVEDSGVGIREADREALFARFQQLDGGAERKAEGVGLGLALTRRLATLMGGSVSVESEFGKGSLFRFQIPQRQADDASLSAETAARLSALEPLDGAQAGDGGAPRELRHGRALVVDDIETNIEVARGMLSLYNIESDGALSGRAAIEAVRRGEPRYDLVLMDHMMPEMNGVETAARIRALEGDYARTVPIIALTANTMADSARMFLSAGFNGYLAKPLDIEKLDAEMAKLSRHRAAPLQLELCGEGGAFADINIEGMDFTAGMRRFADVDMYKNIIRSFTENTPALAADIGANAERARASGTLPGEYTILVHGIKGAARAIGAERVGSLAEELEKAAKAGDAPLALEKTPVFLAETLALVEALRAAFAAPESASEKERRDKPDAALLKRLAAACDAYEIAEIDTLLEELEKYDYAEEGDIVTFLRRQIDDCEFAAVSKKIHECIEPA